MTAGQRATRRAERNGGVENTDFRGAHLPLARQRRVQHAHRARHGQQATEQRNAANQRVAEQKTNGRHQGLQRMLTRLRRRGIHFTDLGMMRYADLVCPIIKKAIK